MREKIEYGEFEKEMELSRDDLKAFLQKMLEKIDQGRITCKFEEREIYVDFVEPVKVEVEYKGSSEKETLKVKFKFNGKVLPEVPPFQ
ncbi:amphi-Trp domain-containing protein [Archaeoglobus sp.]